MGSCANFATAFLRVSRSSELGLKGDILTAADGITYSRWPLIHNDKQETICGFASTNNWVDIGVSGLIRLPAGLFPYRRPFGHDS